MLMKKYILGLTTLLACITNTHASDDNRYTNLINCSANNLVILDTAVPARGLSQKDTKAYFMSTVLAVNEAIKIHDKEKVERDLLIAANDIFDTKGKYGISEYSGFSNQQLADFINNSVRGSDKYCMPFLSDFKKAMQVKHDLNNPESVALEKRIQDSTNIVLTLLKLKK